MKSEPKAVFCANLVLKFFDRIAMKLDYFLALDTNHMVVMMFSTLSLIKIAVAGPDRFLNDSAFQEKGNRPINRATGHMVCIFGDGIVQGIGIEMTARLQGFVKNSLSLAGQFETFSF